MTLEQLQDRKNLLQQSLTNLQQSYHIVTGHIQEVDFQIQELSKGVQDECTPEPLANPEDSPVE